VKAEGMRNATFLHSSNYRRNASDVRDKYAAMFCSWEVVPWAVDDDLKSFYTHS